MKALDKVLFSVAGSLQATAVMDIFDPYVYRAYSKTGGIDLNKLRDVDPRVAVLIASKATDLLTLKVAQQPFKHVPYIDGDLAGTITLSLGIRGFSGTVSTGNLLSSVCTGASSGIITQ